MADCPPPEPHQRSWLLNDDILLHILELQVAFPLAPNLNGSALTFARHCSQVCRQWRSLILDAPMLWSKLIDLNSLCDTSDNWKHEVLYRTGTAPLWVSGDIAEKQRGYPFFLSLLDMHWERIQVFTLKFTVVTNRTPDPRWNAMRRPSRHLRSFNIQIAYSRADITRTEGTPNILTQPPVHLLNGGTPALQHLTVYVHHPFIVHIQSPSIRFLTLSFGYSPQDPFPSVLAALRTLIHLESLEVHDYMPKRVATGPLVPTSRALLPRLSLIKFQSPWTTLILFLGQLRPAPGCSISIRAEARMRSEELHAAEGVINGYAQNFWDIHRSQYVEMAIDQSSFKIQPQKTTLPTTRAKHYAAGNLYGSTIINRQDTAPEFSIDLFPWIPLQDTVGRMTFVLACTPKDMLSSVTHLQISESSLGLKNPSPFIPIVNNLTCVEYLAVSPEIFKVITTALKNLIDEHRAGSAHLPALKTLKMLYGESLRAADFMRIVEYAAMRRSAGLAQLRTLDLVDMEAKPLRPFTAALSPAAETVLYPVDIEETYWTQKIEHELNYLYSSLQI